MQLDGPWNSVGLKVDKGFAADVNPHASQIVEGHQNLENGGKGVYECLDVVFVSLAEVIGE